MQCKRPRTSELKLANFFDKSWPWVTQPICDNENVTFSRKLTKHTDQVNYRIGTLWSTKMRPGSKGNLQEKDYKFGY